MRIDPRFASLPVAPQARPREGAASGRFTLDDPKRATTGSARAAAPLATLDAILALQAEEDPGHRRRRGAQAGREVLDALDALKAAVLGGSIPAATLSTIAAKLADLPATGDPALDGILGEIDLRARVELAKLGLTA